MKTVISDDRVSRFAELDEAVMEEVRAIVEAGNDEAVPTRGTAALHRALERLGTRLKAGIRLR
jgi:hypothetical protein